MPARSYFDFNQLCCSIRDVLGLIFAALLHAPCAVVPNVPIPFPLEPNFSLVVCLESVPHHFCTLTIPGRLNSQAALKSKPIPELSARSDEANFRTNEPLLFLSCIRRISVEPLPSIKVRLAAAETPAEPRPCEESTWFLNADFLSVIMSRDGTAERMI